jgi:hypothetical protein
MNKKTNVATKTKTIKDKAAAIAKDMELPDLYILTNELYTIANKQFKTYWKKTHEQ